MIYVVKALIFTVFLGLVYFISDYFIDILKIQIANIPFSPLFCQFGIWSGLKIFMSILVTSFAFKQVLSFLK